MKFKSVGIVLLIVIVVFVYSNYNPNNNLWFPKCPFYLTTGFYCPGCGSQRAFYDFLHLNFIDIARKNVLFIFGVFILSYHLVIETINKFLHKHWKNYIYHSKFPIIILIVIILFWIVRNLPFYPFNLLAPH